MLNMKAAADSLFARARRSFYAILVAGLLIFFSACLAIFIHDESALFGLTIAAFLLQIFEAWCKWRMTFWFTHANDARRLHQLENGLGLRPSPLEVKRIQAVAPMHDIPYDSTYFASQERPGPRRLIESLEESAFYSEMIAGWSEKIFLYGSLTGCLVPVATLLITLGWHSDIERSVLIDKLVIACLAFFLAGDWAQIFVQYRMLRKAAGESVEEANRLLRCNHIENAMAMSLSLSYNLAIVQAPPTINFLYVRFKPKIAQLYEEYKKSS
jgi:hypothetical protein